eukprot:jgi/Undpi1/2202/HiC_scaffold_12.g05588.m1
MPRGYGCALSMGMQEDALEAETAAVRGMRVSEIKKDLEEMRIATAGIYEKEGLVQMLVAERTRIATPPATPNAAPTRDDGNTKRSSYGDWTPPPETWTEAKFGAGSGAARVTSEGTVLPMVRIRPSESVLGDGISVDQKDYYCVEIGLPDAPAGPTTELFMLDTAATSSLLTPRASKRLGAVKTGISAMGAAGTEGMSGLFQVSLGEVVVAGQSFGSLKPVVMELPITDIRGKGSDGMEKGVAGILGMDFFSRFDVKLDFRSGDATFANPGVAASGALGSGKMADVPGKVLPTGFFMIDVKLEPAGGGKGRPASIPAVIDLGSAFTIANWSAGKAAGLDPRGSNVKYNGQVVAGAAAPGEVYKPVEVGEANMDMIIQGQQAGSHELRGRPVMFADLPGFKDHWGSRNGGDGGGDGGGEGRGRGGREGAGGGGG